MSLIHTINLTRSKYGSVKAGIEKANLEVLDTSEADFVWYDGTTQSSEFFELEPNQRSNRIPNLDNICTKLTFHRCTEHARNQNSRVFSCFPISFSLPTQYSEFFNYCRKLSKISKDPVTWIAKPRSGCCGTGIKLYQNTSEIPKITQPVIIQLYVTPFLLNSFKFDFRFYLFISTLFPFTAYIYHDGLARFCTNRYESPTPQNLDNTFIHLTNTAINVKNENAVSNFTRLASSVIDNILRLDTKATGLWEKIKTVCSLSMIAIYPQILSQLNEYESAKRASQRAKAKFCFHGQKPIYVQELPPLKKYSHLIGIDILIDHLFNPTVLEINDRPSLCVTFEVERGLKERLIQDIFQLVSVDGEVVDPANISSNWEKIVPNSNNPIVHDAEKLLIKPTIEKASPVLTSSATRVIYPKDPKMEKLPPLKKPKNNLQNE